MEEIEALERAWSAAVEAGDSCHAAALERAIQLKKRTLREREAGVTKPIAIWMG